MLQCPCSYSKSASLPHLSPLAKSVNVYTKYSQFILLTTLLLLNSITCPTCDAGRV